MEKTGHKKPTISSSSSHQPWSARVTDEENMIITRDGLLMDPHQQVGLSPGLPLPTARGVPLPSPHHLSRLTSLQGRVPVFSRGQNHFPSAWFESTFCGFLFLVIFLCCYRQMETWGHSQGPPGTETVLKRRGSRRKSSLGVEHPHQKMVVPPASCPWNFP